MSKPGDNGDAPDAAAFARLEGAVAQLLTSLGDAQQQVTAAEARSAEMAELVKRFTGSEADASQLMGRLKRLETENTDLRTRLERGRAGVDRMIARIRFLENQA